MSSKKEKRAIYDAHQDLVPDAPVHTFNSPLWQETPKDVASLFSRILANEPKKKVGRPKKYAKD